MSINVVVLDFFSFAAHLDEIVRSDFKDDCDSFYYFFFAMIIKQLLLQGIHG
jgi:hypothetical protein